MSSRRLNRINKYPVVDREISCALCERCVRHPVSIDRCIYGGPFSGWISADDAYRIHISGPSVYWVQPAARRR